MTNRLILTSCLVLILLLQACGDAPRVKIEASLNTHARQSNPESTSVKIDSVSYSPADSTVYFNHLLALLEQKSESFSRMAKLRADLAQDQMNKFLSGNKDMAERNKKDLDKSLEELKRNEREWDLINDSMDLMLNAVHRTDTSKKMFYTVSYSLVTATKQKQLVQYKKAVLNKDDFKIVLAD